MADNAKPVLLSSTKQPRFIDPNASLSKQQEMFLALMRDPPENSRVITIVPAMAEWLLASFNVGGNRKKKPMRIQRYADSMSEDTWMLTGEPLIFGKQRLLDRTGCPVVYGPASRSAPTSCLASILMSSR
jgi:hypothetical protein